ncbi:MAG: PDZ domain-containing protein [Gemmatimonadales bacterium]|jgi:predicted metalloprotease with PDZ domain
MLAVSHRVAAAGLLLALATPLSSVATAQMAAAISAPVSDIRYDVTADSAAAANRHIAVVTTVTMAGPGPLVLALPAWTPGAYELTWFSRWVAAFSPATPDGKPLVWDKVDYETWRIETGGAKTVQVTFTYEADSLDNAMSWTRPDFVLFNGTNLFLYPAGRGLNFPATVTVHTSPSWLVATGMTAGSSPGSYTAPTYHDLVDMPFFIGRFDFDSVQTGERWVRYASYPAGSVAGPRRATVLRELGQVIPPEAAVFGEVPWTNYTVMQINDSSFSGASGLEHQNSHVDVVGFSLLDNPFMPGLYAHEIFHSWNVKRMRPAEMVPYRYDVAEPTPWLWVSEGITDYYADLAQVRGGVIPDTGFFRLTSGKIDEVAEVPAVALTDASLSTWVHPTDGTGYIYYPKGSLAGFMLDVLIRDASDNHQSLDTVMRAVYTGTYKKGRGFTGSDWWGTVSRVAGGKSFADFNRRFVDGREAFPWDSILPLAGLRLVSDSVREPRLGIASTMDSAGNVRIMQVEPGSAAADADLQPGDILVSLAGIPVTADDFGAQFRARYASRGPSADSTVAVVVRRGGRTITARAPLQFRTRIVHRLEPDPQATPKAVRIRTGILHGVTG